MKVLIFMVDCVGHINSCVGIGQQLSAAGHGITFLIRNHWHGLPESYGFDAVYYNDTDVEYTPADRLKVWSQICDKEGYFQDIPALDKSVNFFNTRIRDFCQTITGKVDTIIENVINGLKPDIIVVDHLLAIPSVIVSGIPWVWASSLQPLSLMGWSDDRLPPTWSGLSIFGDKNKWSEYRKSLAKMTRNTWQEFNDYCVGKGCEPLDKLQFFYPSPYLNIYVYPRELDYQEYQPLPENFYRVDHLMRSDEKQSDYQFVIPETLLDKPGKLIYFSMGTLGSANVANMKRLIRLLAKLKHRFIVSKGPMLGLDNDKDYRLPDNMWGETTVPQIQVLPKVDLVITHGGNNTIAETMYFGKPMIVLPVFIDQLDNAQRIHDLGYGIRLDANNCTEHELLEAIDKLLNDYDLLDRLRQIAQRIQSDNSIANIPTVFEKLLLKN
ncbi:NDP-glycosyltransferase YjiC-like [Oppia nitens]|uniref:NDP-glycosyltransferase YjiC-like n=1 Tax=Oppia nitens TaxID=1686743 RepID=UPI0023DB2A1C|nr:NDP-glycosyltransferase YjiC-like [Oppia nitens]